MGDRLKLQDCKCPICMCILIEPVRLPCDHELCMPCFKKNVEEAHFTCPICRQRISSWARKQVRANQLVDLERWKQIQAAFPVLCQKRLNGEDDDSDYEYDDAESPVERNIRVALPGEIRKEYEQEISKFQRIREEEEKQASEQSEQLIKQLQKEEIRRYEERRKQEEAQRIKDAELAKRLAAQLEQDDSWRKKQEEQAALDEKLARKLQEQDQSPPPSAVISLLSPSTSSQRGASMKCNRLEHLFNKMESRRVSSGDSSRESSQETQPSPAHAFTAFSPTAATSRLPSMEAVDASSNRTKSTESEDSIASEVCHFKPIKTSPRTARRRLADGSRDSPPIIHSTPRNLNKLQKNRKNDYTSSRNAKFAEMLSKKLKIPSPEMESRVSRKVQVSPEISPEELKGVCESNRVGTPQDATSSREALANSHESNSTTDQCSSLSGPRSKLSRPTCKAIDVESNHSSVSQDIRNVNAGGGRFEIDHKTGHIKSTSAHRKRGTTDVKLKDENENCIKEGTENGASREKHRCSRADVSANGDHNKTVDCSHSDSAKGKSRKQSPKLIGGKGKRRHQSEPRKKGGAKTIEKYMQLMTAEQRKLKQEELDRRLALELQRKFEEEEAIKVVRTKGSEDAYPLRAGRKRDYQEMNPETEA